MTEFYSFVVAMLVALGCAGGVVLALAQPLYRVVIDLCGTADRARFWTAYVCVLFVLAPVLAVSFASGRGGIDLVGSVFWSVLALFLALLVFGFNVWKPSARLFDEARRAARVEP